MLKVVWNGFKCKYTCSRFVENGWNYNFSIFFLEVCKYFVLLWNSTDDRTVRKVRLYSKKTELLECSG